MPSPWSPARRRAVLCVLSLLLLPVTAQAAPIHDAAAEGDLAEFQRLLAEDPTRATLADERQSTPLHFAAHGGNVEIVGLLLEEGADLEALDVDGDTALHWAAANDQVDVIARLLEAGANIDAQNHTLFTPLLYAVRHDHLAAATALIDAGADLELAMNYGRTPLLWVARETGSLAMARLLIDRGANVNALDISPSPPIELAAWRGFRTLVDMLLDAGARVDLNERMPSMMLRFAVERGLERLYAVAIEAGAVPDPDDGTLHTASRGGAAGIVRDLLERGAAVDATDRFGWTPLHYAARFERPEVSRLLLEHGAAVEPRSYAGWSPCNLAESRGATALVDLLRSSGASGSPQEFPELSGPFLGQGDPPDRLSLFAPDIVGGALGEHSSPSFTPDGREAYWSAHIEVPDSGYVYGTIVCSRERDGRWTPPQPASFIHEFSDDSPVVSPDGQRLYFMSSRPMPEDWSGNRSGEHIWVVERAGDGWGEPRPLPPIVNDMPHHWHIGVAASGNLYFASRRGEAGGEEGLFVARLVDGEYQRPEFLGFSGHTPYVTPDESVLLYTDWGQRGPENVVRKRTPEGGWGEKEPIFEGWGGGLCPRISLDGRAFFVLADLEGENNVYWLNAGLLKEMME